MLQVGGEGEQAEEGAEHIFPFGDPGDRFDVQGVHGEQRGNERTGSQPAGRLPQAAKHQQAVQRMQQHIGEVIPAG